MTLIRVLHSRLIQHIQWSHHRRVLRADGPRLVADPNLTGVINFTHGGFLAIGGYLAYALLPYFGFWGALVLAPILTGLIGILVERVLIRRFTGAIRSIACF